MPNRIADRLERRTAIKDPIGWLLVIVAILAIVVAARLAFGSS